MATFLQQVAKDLINKFGTNLSQISVVFPNKRASLFLNEELIRQSNGKPVWSPQYLTISELFRQQSDLVVADKIQLICELYKHYVRITGSKETLDEFYGWGEMMLADFDDLDKNMGDADKIFQNTSDLHAFDNDDFLTEEQKETLTRFFSNFNGTKSQLKENFLKLWNHLGQIYKEYKEALREQGIAYEGMLYRDVIELEEQTTNTQYPTPNTFAFVGFNLLQKVEQSLFERLAREDKAKFYWDYDAYYMNEGNEAGKYIKQLMKPFPNEIAESPIYDNLAHVPGITYMSASTEDIQARFVSEWLTPERIAAGKRTAIILGDEKLLPTVIHCLPETVENVNITTGYPLSQTLSATLVKQYFDLKLTGYSIKRGAMRLHNVNNILRHPYLRYVSENAPALMKDLNEKHIFYPTLDDLSIDEHLKMLFSPLTPEQEKDNLTRNKTILSQLIALFQRIAINYGGKSKENTVPDANDGKDKEEKEKIDALTQESLYRMYQILNRVQAMVDSGDLDVDVITLQGLVNQIIRTATVPFHGEPIIGIQIMGVLETRNLDFDHILVLSCNEGNLPKGVNDASFIPHALRHAYELTTVENKIAIYAYYFHRMLQRGTDITLVYNNATNDTKTNEMSRFMMQLMAESNISIIKKNLSSDLSVSQKTINDIPKSKEIITLMNSMDHISPSAINLYLNCQLKFFYNQICKIKDKTESDEEDLDIPTFGSIFHRAAQEIYDQWQGKRALQEEDIKAMLDDKSFVKRAIDIAFREELFQMKGKEYAHRPTPKLDGTQIVFFNIIERLIRSMLEYDIKNTPLKIIELEKWCDFGISFEDSNGTNREIRIGGYIDRLDSIIDPDGQEHVRIIDYKTGNSTVKASDMKSLDDVFSSDEKLIRAHSGYYLQTMLYAFCKMHKPINTNEANVSNYRISPALLYPHYSKADNYNPILCIDKQPINDIRDYADDYEKHIKSLLHNIFDYTQPFHPTSNTDSCEKCPYNKICGHITMIESQK